jgi:hypothetical protein
VFKSQKQGRSGKRLDETEIFSYCDVGGITNVTFYNQSGLKKFNCENNPSFEKFVVVVDLNKRTDEVLILLQGIKRAKKGIKMNDRKAKRIRQFVKMVVSAAIRFLKPNGRI